MFAVVSHRKRVELASGLPAWVEIGLQEHARCGQGRAEKSATPGSSGNSAKLDLPSRGGATAADAAEAASSWLALRGFWEWERECPSDKSWRASKSGAVWRRTEATVAKKG
eukprot:scaffold289397_cov30-Tisochrysis_lutea.AAC.9